MSTTPPAVPSAVQPAVQAEWEYTGWLPVLVGRLDYVLPRRWDSVPDEVVERVCSIDSMPDAMVETVRVLHGADAIVFADTSIPRLSRIVWLLDGTPDVLTKVSPLDRTPEPGQVEMIGGLTASDPDAEMWASLRGSQGLEARRHLITLALQQAGVHPWTLTECLSAKTLRMALWRTFLMAGFGLWWLRAMRQGHTPSSASTLLALIADPATLAHVVEWPTDDSPHTGLVVTPRPEGTPRYAPA